MSENNVHLTPYNRNDDVRNTSKTPLWEQVKDAMRRMTGNYLHILVGLSLAWLMAMGCAAEPAAGTPTTTEIVSNGTPEPATPATALTPTSPSPDVDDAAATAPPHRESNSATPATTLTAAAGSEKRDSLADSSLAYIGELAEGLGARESATEQELKAAEYLMARFTELGYSPELQGFEQKSQTASLAIDALAGIETEEIRASPLGGSTAGQVSGAPVLVGLGGAGDVPSEGLNGEVALIESGEITFRSKVDRVAAAGAVAAVVFNNRPGGFRGTLGEGSTIPVLAISQEAGNRLRNLMAETNVEMTVAVEETAELSRNVIAELPGTGEGIVIVGAHYDTVPEVIGANDNASGIGVMLSLAGDLAGRQFPFTLRFMAFGSEETGLNGSRHYVDGLSGEEVNEIKAMVNLDVVGSGEALRVTGDRWLTNHVSEAAARDGTAVTVSRGLRGGSSDHASFREAWVPVIFFHADDTSRIHTPQDTMEFINPRLLGDTASLVLDLLDSLDDWNAGPG